MFCGGRLPNDSHLMTGRRSLEFSWHCLARLCSPQRSPIGLTSVEALHAAHDRLLRCSSVRNSSSTSVTERSYARAGSATRRTCCSSGAKHGSRPACARTPSHCRAGDRSVRYDWRVLRWCRCRCANIETTVLSTCRRRWSRRYRSGPNLANCGGSSNRRERAPLLILAPPMLHLRARKGTR